VNVFANSELLCCLLCDIGSNIAEVDALRLLEFISDTDGLAVWPEHPIVTCVCFLHLSIDVCLSFLSRR